MSHLTSSSPASLSRRDALFAFGASALALGTAFFSPRARAADAEPAATTPAGKPAPKGPFTLPPLGFSYDALEPVIGQATMELHHKRHHQAYVDNANIALENNPELHKMSAEEMLRGIKRIPGVIQQAVRNNVGGHFNHTLFWDILTPGGPKMPGGSLDRRISADFSNFETFIRELSASAISRFGSGWAWLCVYNRKLSVYSTANQDSPLMDGATPILGIDVWEHAYYLNYQNRRADYVKSILGLINWDHVEKRLDAAMH